MAIRNIIKEGDIALRKKCKTVEVFDARLHILLDDMKETMLKEDGVGLAANQIGILKRAVVIGYDDEFLELINPVLLHSEGEAIDYEGCLSIEKSRNGKVKRPTKVVVKAKDRHGNTFEITKEDWIARIICHELDHLEGVLFTDKVIREQQ